ncbi:MAG: phage tail protein [Bacteroidales bacterium]|nr:phage tail protein [Bacteroidales bacterium]
MAVVQIYADGALVFDSRLEEYALEDLTVTSSVKKAGSMELVMPPLHPAYNSFVAYKTVVEVFIDNELIFRGRALHPADDFYNCRTVTGEGERCFLRDGTMRPYMYQDGPAAIFADVINLYNAQVEAYKQFVVGEVTVTDPNNYIRLESEKAEQFSDTIDKLVERCGGYIIFTSNAEGQRVINWYEKLEYRSNQVIEFGENLLDFTREDENDDLATVVVPYGAKDQETGERITIESVNDGLDFIQDYDAVALRGVISRPVYWDDVTEPANLLAKAQKWLAEHKLVITKLELSAADLSALDQYIDSFREGDTVRVRSKPHGVDDDFVLYERKYKPLLNDADTVTMGKEQATLTGADAAGEKTNRGELLRVTHEIKRDYQLNIAAAIAATEATLSSLIQQTSDAIKLEVSEVYATNDTVTEAISSSMTQLVDSFNFEFTTLRQELADGDAATAERVTMLESWVRVVKNEDGTAKLVIGDSESPVQLELENDILYFMDGGARVAYMSNKQLVITDAHFLNSLRVGAFAWVPRENGNLSLVKVG